MSAVTTASNQSLVSNIQDTLPESNPTSILALAVNAKSLTLVYPYFRPIDPKNAMYHRAPIILQIPRFAPAHPPQPYAQFAGGSYTGDFRGAQRLQPGQPPTRNVNSAALRERTARHFGGKYAKRANYANFANHMPYK